MGATTGSTILTGAALGGGAGSIMGGFIEITERSISGVGSPHWDRAWTRKAIGGLANGGIAGVVGGGVAAGVFCRE